MKVTVYIPKKLNIEESEIPALKEKARRRLRLAGDREVPGPVHVPALELPAAGEEDLEQLVLAGGDEQGRDGVVTGRAVHLPEPQLPLRQVGAERARQLPLPLS